MSRLAFRGPHALGSVIDHPHAGTGLFLRPAGFALLLASQAAVGLRSLLPTTGRDFVDAEGTPPKHRSDRKPPKLWIAIVRRTPESGCIGHSGRADLSVIGRKTRFGPQFGRPTDVGVPCRDRAYARKVPGCPVRTLSQAMLSRKCSGRTRSHTASEVRTSARY